MSSYVWKVCAISLSAFLCSLEAGLAGDPLTCDVVSSRVLDLIRAGKREEAKKYVPRVEACRVEMIKQQEEKSWELIDGYDRLIRGARETPSYDGPKTFVESCERAIKLLLKSPSTYKRISATELPTRPISDDEFLAEHRDLPRFRAILDATGHKPVRFRAFISYDVANAFGTPVRATDECAYEASDASDIPGPYSVKVNGRSGLQGMFAPKRSVSR